MEVMNLDQEFHSFGVSETLRRQAVLVHNHRTGMALYVLERWDEYWSAWNQAPRTGAAKRWALASQTRALIDHDRIMRGET